MRSKVSFLIVNHQDAAMRRVTFTTRFLKLTVVALAALVVGGAYLAHHSYRQRILCAQSSADELALRIQQQNQQIAGQKIEIQKFAQEINLLKDELMALNAIEKKIRLFANMSRPEIKDPRYGIGGHADTDPTAKIAIDQSHQALIQEMNQLTAHLQETVNQQGEGFEELLERLKEKVKILARTPSIRPAAGDVTSKFGYRKAPFSSKKEFHEGYDIGAPKGTPIVATADGVVKFTGRKGGLGKTVIINHGYGYETLYGHNGKIFKKRGESVKKGDLIALMGNTGRSTGPHVHYEVMLNGKNINPADYFTD